MSLLDRMNLGLLAAVIGSISPAGVDAVAAQTDTLVISSEPSCSSCTVRLEKVASLGGPPDSNTVLWNSTVARNSGGEFYVAPTAAPGEIHVYGSDGKFLEKFGQLGRGPDEFGLDLIVAVDPFDSLHVVDNSNGRWTVLGPDHEVARSAPLPGRVRKFFPTRDGRVVFHGHVGTRECFGVPLHLVRADGGLERCFGWDGGSIRSDRSHSQMRQIADGGNGRVWASRVNRYELDLLDPSGRAMKRVIRDADWFEPWSRDLPGAFVRSPPRPRVMGAARSPDGYLVVFIAVPDRDWRAPAGGGPEMVTASALERHFDTVVEVVDPASGVLIGSTRFPTQLLPTPDGTLAYSASEQPTGDDRIDVWKVVVTETPEMKR